MIEIEWHVMRCVGRWQGEEREIHGGRTLGDK